MKRILIAAALLVMPAIADAQQIRTQARTGECVSDTRTGARTRGQPSAQFSEYDIILEVPDLCVRQIRLRVRNLDAHVSVNAAVANLVRRQLVTRLADQLLGEAGIPEDPTLSHLTRDERRELVRVLTRYPLPWTGDEGYKKAEVTGGGVALDEVNPRTLESRRHPGLFLSGELLDAFGPIGGYNFAWAWATGRLAGLGAAGAVG